MLSGSLFDLSSETLNIGDVEIITVKRNNQEDAGFCFQFTSLFSKV